MLGGSEDGRQVIEDTLHEDLNPLEDTNGDDLTLAAMKALGAVSVPHHESTTGIHRSIIPTDNLLKLIELLLLIAPLENQESLADYAAQLTDERVSELHDTAHHVLAAFGAERNLGIT
ncbi:Restriction of telomere capping protein 5, partial [Cryomyces antarcticus]